VVFTNAEILVAQAGLAELADRAVDLMQQKAVGVSVENPDSVMDVAVSAVRQIRNDLWQLNHLSDFSQKEAEQFFFDYQFELLLGFCCKKKPHLFTLNLSMCVPLPVKGRYRAIGIGADLAEYLIRQYAVNDPEFSYAYLIAGSVVQRVIDNVDGCGLPVWIGLSYPVTDEILSRMKSVGRHMSESLSDLIPRQEIDMLLDEVRAVQDLERNTSHDMFRLMLVNLDDRRRKMFGIDPPTPKPERLSPTKMPITVIPMAIIPTPAPKTHFNTRISDDNSPTLALRERIVVSISDRAMPSLSVIASISSMPSSIFP
jgi:hypothetical protein